VLKTDHIQQAPNLAWLAKKSAEMYKDQVAMTLVLANGMNGNLSFAKLDELSDQFAVYLREDLKLPEATAVAIQMPNCLSYPIAALGVFKAGLVLVNMNPLYTVPEMIHQLNDSQSQVLVSVDIFKDKATEIMSKTGVKHVVIAKLPEFLPVFPKSIAQLVIKYWNKQIPSPKGPFSSFVSCLKSGQVLLKEKSVQIENYSKKVTDSSVAVLQYTGGTTGVSKGAALTHGNLLSNMRQLLPMLNQRLDSGSETILTALPLYHIFAFTLNFLSFHAIGARNILCPNPRPISNLQRAIENYALTVFAGVNTLYNALNNEDWFRETPPPKLKMAVAGGMALHSQVADEFQKITGIPIVEGYGLTETSPVVSFNPFEKQKPNSIGKPIANTEIRLVNDRDEDVAIGQPGELIVKGPQVMQGYWKNPKETANALKNGWFYTGDIAIKDEDGYYKIVDRKKDMILVSGFNVYPNEVEDVLTQHPDVLEAAVIGVADDQTGEAVKAFVVTKAGEKIASEDLKNHCKKSLVNYKVPKVFEFRSSLPKTPVGKILRKDLRNQVALIQQETL
jgi:long-chain acyl-CoA synthetase